jgi:hypothetical protein
MTHETLENEYQIEVYEADSEDDVLTAWKTRAPVANLSVGDTLSLLDVRGDGDHRLIIRKLDHILFRSGNSSTLIQKTMVFTRAA